MNDERILLQPGVMFFEAWRGCMTFRGVTIKDWAKANGVSEVKVRQCATGAMNGPKSQALREKMIADAGQDLILQFLRERFRRDHGVEFVPVARAAE